MASRIPFGPLAVEYDERTLEPRPWTLAQSEWAAELAAALPAGPILELCAGVGHIGLATALWTDRPLVQVDLNPAACAWARTNAAAAGVDQVDVREGSMLSSVRAGEMYSVVLADPPYLPTGEIDRYPADPRLAVDGGADGLDLVRQCITVGSDHLDGGGAMLLQLRGLAQALDVERVLAPDTALTLREVRGFGPERAIALLRRSTRPQR